MIYTSQIPQSNYDHKEINLKPILLAHQLVLFPLYFFIPLWITLLNLVIAGFIFWKTDSQNLPLKMAGSKILQSRMNQQMPVWLKVTITFIAVAGVLATFHKLAGRDAGVALIATMYGLKMLEIKSRRDVYVVMILGFFLLLAGFLFDQSPWIAIYQFIPVAAILNALMSVHLLQTSKGLLSQSLAITFKRLAKYLILAIPLMIVLFVFFPRLSGPIWKMPGGSSGSSGISDTMSPGEISNLQLFDKVAFRVKFDGAEPNENLLYWRTLVLDKFDGLTWSRNNQANKLKRKKQLTEKKLVSEKVSPLKIGIPSSEEYRYEISLESTQLNWLTMLDRPTKIPATSRQYNDYAVQVRHRIVDRIRYKGTSQPRLMLDRQLPSAKREHYTQLPNDGNSRSLNWAREQRKNYSDDKNFIRGLLSMINQGEYFYTLSPPIMTEDTVDSFWFDEQRGFCEHYASTLVFMARAANIPARVVVGYQGADKNPLSDYWIVRYANAHAWTEIWLENEGWVRVDPTAAIASHRIEEQLQLDYSQRLSLFDEFGFDAIDLSNIGWAKQFQYWMDRANTGWNDWILDYNQQSQRKLFSGLGLERFSIQQISILMMGILAGFLAVISLKWVKMREKKEPMEIAFEVLCQKLTAYNFTLKDNIGPQDLLNLVIEADLQSSKLNKSLKLDSTSISAITIIIKRYIFLRYSQSQTKPEQQKEFLKKVKCLKLTAS